MCGSRRASNATQRTATSHQSQRSASTVDRGAPPSVRPCACYRYAQLRNAPTNTSTLITQSPWGRRPFPQCIGWLASGCVSRGRRVSSSTYVWVRYKQMSPHRCWSVPSSINKAGRQRVYMDICKPSGGRVSLATPHWAMWTGRWGREVRCCEYY